MIILYGVAFISGLFTILAPCIWPLLPIVLADVTQSKSKRRPLGITVGVALSFAFLTLAVAFLESSLGLNPNILRKLAVVVLLVIGFSMVVPALSHRMEASISRLAGRFGCMGRNQRSDFSGGIVDKSSMNTLIELRNKYLPTPELRNILLDYKALVSRE